MGLRLRYCLCGVKRMLIQRKAEAGFYNLNRTDLTFEALAVAWLHSLQNSIKESTYAYYSYTLHKYLLPVLSKVPVTSLEESFLEQAMQQIIAPTDAAHKPLGNFSARECLSPDPSNGAGSCTAKSHQKKFLRLSPRRSSSSSTSMYRRILHPARSAYYWGWNWGFELVRFAAFNGVFLT